MERSVCIYERFAGNGELKEETVNQRFSLTHFRRRFMVDVVKVIDDQNR